MLALAVIVATAAVSGCAAPTTTWSAPAARPSAPPAAPDPTPATTPAPPEPDEIAPAGFVALSDVDPTIVQDIRYQTDHNFVGRPIAGYREPLCLLTRAAAERLHRVQLAARSHGYTLKVYDCYRPQRAVDDFVRWGQRPDDQRMKAEFYPNLDKPALFAQGFIAGPTAHSRGSTVDLTLVATPPRVQRPYAPDEALASCVAPGPERFPDNTVEMGTGFDCFDPLAHTMNPRVTGAARQHRLLLTQLMAGAGFRNYAEEWWHYSLMTEPYPDTYFDFPVARAALAHP
ncbi:D-alanyl-D-alanine dipeptidase [Micromonospora pattaloongensis]|uniref:D-alanyl-D-alanine dipeptidase n=1 Tax=Micromonospora pattaloongensis TaxID=405436 RepID=A0A1H3RXP2_9ACTN|nr:D-alanyl-D-alanine dipeptidase [Micromonospora pattaloongensis]